LNFGRVKFHLGRLKAWRIAGIISRVSFLFEMAEPV